MFAKWLEEYQRLSEKSRFVSKLASFLVAIFSFLSLYDIAVFFKEHIQHLNSLVEDSGLLTYVTYQILIFVIFAARFVMLFLKSMRAFWISQILWIFGVVILATYWFISRPSENMFGIYSTYTSIFIFASRSFDFIGMWYLILSPVRQVVNLIIPFVKEK